MSGEYYQITNIFFTENMTYVCLCKSWHHDVRMLWLAMLFKNYLYAIIVFNNILNSLVLILVYLLFCHHCLYYFEIDEPKPFKVIGFLKPFN